MTADPEPADRPGGPRRNRVAAAMVSAVVAVLVLAGLLVYMVRSANPSCEVQVGEPALAVIQVSGHGALGVCRSDVNTPIEGIYGVGYFHGAIPSREACSETVGGLPMSVYYKPDGTGQNQGFAEAICQDMSRGQDLRSHGGHPAAEAFAEGSSRSPGLKRRRPERPDRSPPHDRLLAGQGRSDHHGAHLSHIGANRSMVDGPRCLTDSR